MSLDSSKGNGSAKWQMAFWVLSSVVVGSMFFLAKEVIALNNRNTYEHTEIRQKIYEELIITNERLAAIEAIVGIEKTVKLMKGGSSNGSR